LNSKEASEQRKAMGAPKEEEMDQGREAGGQMKGKRAEHEK
jgi:hypothetical protein